MERGGSSPLRPYLSLLLLLKYDKAMNLEMFKNMVRIVNKEDVPKEDVLSDSVYLYFREKNQISVV